MRALFSPELMPVLHHSSFDVPMHGALPPGSDDQELGLLSFIEQARQVCVGTQAIVQRAERERMSTLVEGVHLIPGLIQGTDVTRCAVVEIVVHIEDEATHRSHFAMRGLQTDGGRAVEHYLSNFERIREIQDYLVAQAQRRGVPVVENSIVDDTVRRLTDYTLDVVERVASEMEMRKAASSSPISSTLPAVSHEVRVHAASEAANS
jgi:2-phosphoglycerate kinase